MQPTTPPPVERIPARLVFDTADYPLRRGVRRRDVTSRHQVFHAGEYCIDLLLERRSRAPGAVLVGQLGRLGRPLDRLAAIDVELSSEGGPLARTVSNRAGEFQLEYQPARPMELRLAVAAGSELVVPVDRRTTKRIAVA